MAAGDSQKFVSKEGFLLMQDKIETQRGENRILRQKLQSKAEALLILSRELEKARAECDDYRELTETLRTKYSSLKLLSSAAADVSSSTAERDSQQPFNSRACRDSSVAKRFAELREENRRLAGERERLRRVLKDREEDVRLMRGQLRLKESICNGQKTTMKDKEDDDLLVRRMEALQDKYSHLKQDLQSLLDEKEDLVQERDSYKCKVHRLNHALSALLKNDGFKAVDLDWILAENRRLQEGLAQLQEEKQLANEMGKRYKAALLQSKVTFSSPDMVASNLSDKILCLVRQTSFPCPVTVDLRDPDSLRELCLSLLETLSDRMLQLKHQRTANAHLLSKLRTLEEKILSGDNGELMLHPSQYLMQGYSAANVDEESAGLEELEAVELTSRESEDSIEEEKTGEVNNPPDIIVQGLSRACSVVIDDVWQKEGGINRMEASEDTIVLPDHLQFLVDQAMRSLVEQAE